MPARGGSTKSNQGFTGVYFDIGKLAKKVWILTISNLRLIYSTRIKQYHPLSKFYILYRRDGIKSSLFWHFSGLQIESGYDKFDDAITFFARVKLTEARRQGIAK